MHVPGTLTSGVICFSHVVINTYCFSGMMYKMVDTISREINFMIGVKK